MEQGKGRDRRTALVCGLAALCLLVSLIPALREAVRAGGAGQGVTAVGLRDSLCRALVSAGLPPTGSPLFGWGKTDTYESETETETISETEACPETADTPTAPLGGAEEPTAPLPELESDPATRPVPETEAGESAPDESQTAPPSSPDQPVIRQDMSEYRRGALYMWNESQQSLPAIPEVWRPTGTGEPLVLLVCSHPFESYIRPEDGGVAELALSLADALRAQGVQVICVSPEQLGLTAESSVRECYTRTQAAVRYYCRLYGRVSLVLDLRRSAEMVGEASLAAVGWVEEAPVAQVRFTVDQLREAVPTETSSDLALALTLRQALFARAPALSRPVYVRATQGLLSEVPAGTPVPTFLTVELGASGNSFAEASRALDYLAPALAAALARS